MIGRVRRPWYTRYMWAFHIAAFWLGWFLAELFKRAV